MMAATPTISVGERKASASNPRTSVEVFGTLADCCRGGKPAHACGRVGETHWTQVLVGASRSVTGPINTGGGASPIGELIETHTATPAQSGRSAPPHLHDETADKYLQRRSAQHHRT